MNNHILFGGILLGLGAGATMFNRLDSLFFFPGKTLDSYPSSIGIPFEAVTVPDKDYSISAWYMKGTKTARKVILFSHGNAGTMADRFAFIAFWHRYLKNNYSLFMFDYPGFGESRMKDFVTSSTIKVTRPSIDKCKSSLRSCIAYLLSTGFHSEEIMLYGESIGGAITAIIATEYVAQGVHFDKIVLQSTFTDLYEIASHFYPMAAPLVYLLSNRLNVLESIRYLKSHSEKVLLMHSRTDDIVPYSMYHKMKDHATQLFELNGSHNNTLLNEDVAIAILE